jgi:hypothetical protein
MAAKDEDLALRAYELTRLALEGDTAARRELAELAFDEEAGMAASVAATYLYMERRDSGAVIVPVELERIAEYAAHTLLTLAAEAGDALYLEPARRLLAEGSWQLRLAAAYYLYSLEADEAAYEQRLIQLADDLQAHSLSFDQGRAPSPVYRSLEEARSELIAQMEVVERRRRPESPLERKLLWLVQQQSSGLC